MQEARSAKNLFENGGIGAQGLGTAPAAGKGAAGASHGVSGILQSARRGAVSDAASDMAGLLWQQWMLGENAELSQMRRAMLAAGLTGEEAAFQMGMALASRFGTDAAEGAITAGMSDALGRGVRGARNWLENGGIGAAAGRSWNTISDAAGAVGDTVNSWRARQRHPWEAGPSKNAKSEQLDSTSSIRDNDSKVPLVNGPYIRNGKPYGRPHPGKKEMSTFEETVYAASVGNGQVLKDPNTAAILPWKPGEPRQGVVDFGHKPGRSYRSVFEKYRSGEITKEDLIAFQKDPANYQIESPSANRSRRYEEEG